MYVRRALALAALLPSLALAHDGRPPPSLYPVGSYSTGLGGNGAEIVSVRRDGLAAITNIAGSVDLLDLTDPANPTLIRRIPVDTTAGAPNSVALHPHRDYLLVVTGTAGLEGRLLAYGLDGSLLASAATGIQPDSVAISPDGEYAVVANEAEGVAVGNDGGPGSITIVDLEKFTVRKPRWEVRQIALPSAAGVPGFSTGRTDDIARLPVTNEPGTLEPESIAFDPEGDTAYVTLQENSGIALVDLESGSVGYLGTGQTTHPADLVVNGVAANTGDLVAFREPDGIAFEKEGRYFYTADEGDTRNAAGSSGPRGGRTVTVYDACSGAVLGDTGSQLDDAAIAAGYYVDARANRGGVEPEVLDATTWKDRLLVAVGLERANAIALVDVTDPAAPLVIDLERVGANPEGVRFFRRKGALYVVSANEADGTVSVLEVR